LIYYGRQLLKQQVFKYVSLAAGIILSFFCVKFAYDLVNQFM